MQTILDFLENTWNGFVDFLYRLVLSAMDMLKDFFFWLFEVVLEFFALVLNGLGQLMTALDVTTYISALPPETKYILSEIGFGQSLGIIASAIAIRMLLNLIPLIRI